MPSDIDLASTLSNGRSVAAEQFLKRALAVREAALGADRAFRRRARPRLGTFYPREFTEAELETSLGDRREDVGFGASSIRMLKKSELIGRDADPGLG